MATLRECGCCGQPETKSCDPDCDAVSNFAEARQSRGEEMDSFLRHVEETLANFSGTLQTDLADLAAPHCSFIEVNARVTEMSNIGIKVDVIYKKEATLGAVDRQIEDLFSQYGFGRNRVKETRTSTSWEFLMINGRRLDGTRRA